MSNAQFAATYLPYATQAGQALGVSPSTVLAQWALESGYGTNATAIANNNFAGIMVPGTQTEQSFATPSAFTTAYENVIASNFPGAENTGADLTAFVNGLTNSSGQIYYGTGTTAQGYFSGLASALGNLEGSGVTPQSEPAVTAGAAALPSSTVGTATAPGTTTAQGACSGFGGVFTWACWSGVITDLAFVAIGVLIFIVAVGVGLFGSHAATQVRREA